MKSLPNRNINLLVLLFFLFSLLGLGGCGAGIVASGEKTYPVSDHFDGNRYFNPDSPSIQGEGPKRGVLGWVWQWMAGNKWPEWPEFNEFSPGPRPAGPRTERDPPDYLLSATPPS